MLTHGFGIKMFLGTKLNWQALQNTFRKTWYQSNRTNNTLIYVNKKILILKI